MKREKLTAICFFVGCVCFCISSAYIFITGGDRGLAIANLCIGSAMLCVGSVWLKKSKTDDTNDDEDR